MKVRSKKVLSAAVVSAILAAQTLMPVAAAGGEITADMSTKSPVLRVQVPTKMAVSVNEFEKGDTGSQITSDAFAMQNKSEIPVNVKVTSKATVGADTTLVSTKKAAEDSTDTAKPAMWLAAVAAVKDNAGTLEYTTATDKTVAGLVGTEDNITAFGTKAADNTSEIVQNFYLQAATAATYKGITGTDVDAEKAAATATIGGADFYELTELSPASDDAAGVTALAATQDVYIAKAGAAAAGTPAVLTKAEKGSTVNASDWTASASKAYKIADTPTKASNLDNSKSYLYIDGATAAAGDSAAFRYIGALSSAKSGWSSTTDLTGITLKYDIVGISGTAYTEVAKADGSGLTYGYKAESSKITITAGGLMTIQGLTGANYKGGVLTLDGTDYEIGKSAGNWVETETAPATYQFSTNWKSQIKGKTVKVEITMTDGTKITETVAVPAA